MTLAPQDLTQFRQDLAAAFRICHRFGWSESMGNHGVSIAGQNRGGRI